MTFWATLWYAGSVVLTLGYEGQTEDQCNQIGTIILEDIDTAYSDPAFKEQIDSSLFPVDLFSYSCETQNLPIDERYAK